MTALQNARNVVSSAVNEFGSSLAVLTSFQREGVLIVDLVMNASLHVPVMTIDTGRLPSATNDVIAAVEQRYGIEVERILPNENEVQAMVSAYGRDLFFDGVAQRSLCCNVRKVRPLTRRLASVGAYFTGIRRDQTETRSAVDIVDRSGSTVKISPLAEWSSEDVIRYTREYNLPESALYAAGYTSIGCDPCTRAIQAGEDERAGRWWWERDTDKECGLHFSPDGRVERTVDVLLRDVLTKAESLKI